MKKTIVTAGGQYYDIDVTACAQAYKELLDLQNVDSIVVLPGPLNESVSKTARSWVKPYETALKGNPNSYDYVLVDISDPSYFASFVVHKNITKLFDHRPGFEKFWKDKLGDNSEIELIGSCATLIWEEFKKFDLENRISPESANLLYTAIISNTLDLKSQNTTQRDKIALKELSNHTKLPENWVSQYYIETNKETLSNPERAMRNDTKWVEIKGESYGIIQIELWNSQVFIDKNLPLIIDLLNELKEKHTFFTSPSISEGINYLITQKESTKGVLANAIGAEFEEDLGKTDKLWLRKEIIGMLNK